MMSFEEGKLRGEGYPCTAVEVDGDTTSIAAWKYVPGRIRTGIATKGAALESAVESVLAWARAGPDGGAKSVPCY